MITAIFFNLVNLFGLYGAMTIVAVIKLLASIGQPAVSKEIVDLIGDLQGYSISEIPTENELEIIVGKILNRMEYYKSDFRKSFGYRSAKIIRFPGMLSIDNLTFFDCDLLDVVYIPDTVVHISADAFEDHPGILVRCNRGSYAEEYCKTNNIKFELID